MLTGSRPYRRANIYIYQFPCPVPPAPKPKATDEPENPEDWIIFPVYWTLAMSTSSSMSPYTTYMSLLGYPMIIAMTKGDARNPDNVYRFIVEQVERYTGMKLFEEVRQQMPLQLEEIRQPEEVSDREETSEGEELTEANAPTTSSDLDDDDNEPLLPKQKLLMAGYRLEPLKLFTMKVASDTRNGDRSGPPELFAMGTMS
ncbi:hypothetical protein BC936DRAFT_144847 [Jimgerdemannia flammicorona]|uniref:Uncharacterized protein n=1 Tax=Jimgerdemannia flammicorona TaxID=994334 RepID=A0A433DBJ4_9FUNG|nr:hypothetical protein BC936DRAFT_144847 [Jimgerdemannia flammicorona]